MQSQPSFALVPHMLNHAAWVTHDVEKTAHFYSHIMRMKIASTIVDDRIPSTGEDFPYFHIFFRMADGSTLAFFESPGLPPASKSSHPAYDVFTHIALQGGGSSEILMWKSWLMSQGVEVLGPVDHKGIIQSIYFHDPSGYRLELTTPVDPQWNQHTEAGQRDLDGWLHAKKAAQNEGRGIKEAMLQYIREAKRRDD